MVKQLFVQDIENKARRLEEANRRNVINCGQGLRVVISEETSEGVRAHPELETAACDFVRAVRFVGNARGLDIETESYRTRMEAQGITLNYSA